MSTSLSDAPNGVSLRCARSGGSITEEGSRSTMRVPIAVGTHVCEGLTLPERLAQELLRQEGRPHRPPNLYFYPPRVEMAGPIRLSG